MEVSAKDLSGGNTCFRQEGSRKFSWTSDMRTKLAQGIRWERRGGGWELSGSQELWSLEGDSGDGEDIRFDGTAGAFGGKWHS